MAAAAAAEPAYIPSLVALDELKATHKYVILDFTAAWCPPCKAIAPLFAKLAREYAVQDVLAFAKVDVDDAPDVAAKYGVTAMPTFLFLVDGEAKGVEVSEASGVSASAPGGSVYRDEASGRVVQIRGADARNLVAVITDVGKSAKSEAAAGEGDAEAEKTA